MQNNTTGQRWSGSCASPKRSWDTAERSPVTCTRKPVQGRIAWAERGSSSAQNPERGCLSQVSVLDKEFRKITHIPKTKSL